MNNKTSNLSAQKIFEAKAQFENPSVEKLPATVGWHTFWSQFYLYQDKTVLYVTNSSTTKAEERLGTFAKVLAKRGIQVDSLKVDDSEFLSLNSSWSPGALKINLPALSDQKDFISTLEKILDRREDPRAFEQIELIMANDPIVPQPEQNLPVAEI